MRVLFLSHLRSGTHRAIVLGARDACLARGWELTVEYNVDVVRALLERDWPHGVLAHGSLPELWPLAQRRRVPMVATIYYEPNVPWPTVCADDERVGALAADHLLDCGVRHFAYLGDSYGAFPLRRNAFVRRLAEHGHAAAEYPRDVPGDGRALLDELPAVVAFLSNLPKPLGAFVCNDRRAGRVLHELRVCGVTVPDEVAVLGVQNCDLACELADVPLSSVDINPRLLGRRAVEVLAGAMAGEAPPAVTRLPPRGVVARRSTDRVAGADPDVAAALRFIRDHAAKPIGVEDVVREAGLGRRALEQRFAAHVGRGLYDEIRRRRFERAAMLLATSDLSLPAVARASGLRGREALTDLVRAFAGTTPAAFRRQHAAPTPTTPAPVRG